MPEEKIDLVNEKNEAIGTITEAAAHKADLPHRASHVFVFNSKGEIFLQLRPKEKFLYPGVWDSSVGEHVKKGESFDAAALRGLKEELNIEGARILFVGEYEFNRRDEKTWNHEFVQLFNCVFDGKIEISKPELEDGRFFSIEEAKRMAEEKKTAPSFRETLGLYLKKTAEKKIEKNLPKSSVIIAAYNNARVLERVLRGMLALDYPKEKFEVIVASDGSTDETAEIMKTKFGKEKRIIFLDLPSGGVCKARNAAIAAASKESSIIVNMDHDCIPEKDWLKNIISGFDSERVGVVSSYNYYGGTSTAFRKDLLEKVGGYDEQYGYYREDTDLSFKIMDLGYEFRRVLARFEHDHKIVKPKGIAALLKHAIKRIKNHENDVLLYKKHPTAVCREFLNIKFGFLVDPASDFGAATGGWYYGGNLNASSPRGIVFLENKTPLHGALIIILGIGYVIAVKLFRLYASVKFRKFLV